MNEIINAYNEYIGLLEKECGKLTIFAVNHGIYPDKADIDKGEELRAKIKELCAKYTK